MVLHWKEVSNAQTDESEYISWSYYKMRKSVEILIWRMGEGAKPDWMEATAKWMAKELLLEQTHWQFVAENLWVSETRALNEFTNALSSLYQVLKGIYRGSKHHWGWLLRITSNIKYANHGLS